MAKKEDITLIIAKAFSKQTFTKEETAISSDLTISKLVTEYGLNDIQAHEVMKWCIMSCASITVESEVLEEGLFSGFLDKLKNNKSKQKTQQEINTIVANNIKNFIDDSDLSDFLFAVKSFVDNIKSKGVYREVNPPKKIAGEPRGSKEEKDLYGDFIDMAQDNKDFSYTADLDQKHLSNLLILKGQLKKVYMTLHKYQLPKANARVDERAPVTRTQLYKDLTPSDNSRKIQFYELNSIVTNAVYRSALGNGIKRQVQIKQLINLLYKNAKVYNREEKLKVIIALKSYIGEIFYNVQDIITGETQTNNISHANYSKEKNPAGTFSYNTYNS